MLSWFSSSGPVDLLLSFLFAAVIVQGPFSARRCDWVLSLGFRVSIFASLSLWCFTELAFLGWGSSRLRGWNYCSMKGSLEFSPIFMLAIELALTFIDCAAYPFPWELKQRSFRIPQSYSATSNTCRSFRWVPSQFYPISHAISPLSLIHCPLDAPISFRTTWFDRDSSKFEIPAQGYDAPNVWCIYLSKIWASNWVSSNPRPPHTYFSTYRA